MNSFEPITAETINDKEEIKKIFDGQSNFLKGVMLLAILQYVILILIL